MSKIVLERDCLQLRERCLPSSLQDLQTHRALCMRVSVCTVVQSSCSDYAPTMVVLSLSSWCDVSIEGIVPDIERGRVAMSRVAGDAGDGYDGCERGA